MNRNVESHFALNPTSLDIKRSTFDRSHSHKTSFNVGQLIPFFVDEVLPGDTFNVTTSKVVRLQTLITPVMDNIYLDTYYFFVPNRLVWSHWKNFMGENTESAWLPTTEYNIPQLTAPSGGWNTGSLADYFGIPTGVSGLSVNALPFRAYAKIIDDWFRDENLTDPVFVPTGDTTEAGTNGSNYRYDLYKGGKPYVATKYHDYFTSCLPSPQKGPDVTIPIGTAISPVIPMSGSNASLIGDNSVPYHAVNYDGSNLAAMVPATLAFKGGAQQVNDIGIQHSSSNPSQMAVIDNLFAVSSTAQMATINQLRLAFQIQKFYEKSARNGSRYIEILKGMFGVTSPDARMQRPEYLGGNRLPININQVINQSQIGGQGTAYGFGQLGSVGAMSCTSDRHSDFTKSFTEHGYIIGLCVARYDHTYQQGINRMWSRKDKFDFYWPVFANIGEQAVKNKEIYADGSSTDDEVFGYQEAWADYRYAPNRVSGEMRSSYAQSLDVWHLADNYSSLPHLSDGWIREEKANVDRVLGVQSSVSNQLFMDVYVQNRCTRPMPMYSVPGLIDHH